MTENMHRFSRELLGAQSADPALRDKYRKEMEIMVSEKIEGGKKIYGYVISAVRLIVGLFLAWIFLFDPFGGPAVMRLVAGIASVVVIFMSLWGGLITSRGLMKPSELNVWSYIVYFFMLALCLVMICYGGFSPHGSPLVMWVVTPVMFLIVGAMVLILNKVKQAEYKSTEQMLQLEYRLAELAEKLEKHPAG